jgi:uncharacterized protein (TIRG00374 family)
MRPRDLFWLIITILLMLLIYQTTGATQLLSLDPLYCLLAVLAFFFSIFFWTFAWISVTKFPLRKSLKINIKALMGIFSPLGIGGDALRVYYSSKERLSPEKALGASFMVKFFKFLMMFAFLLCAIYILSLRSPDFYQNISFFTSAAILTLIGALIVLLAREEKVAYLFYRLFRRRGFILRFHEELKGQFRELDISRTLIITGFLLISTFFEMAAVSYAFLAVGQPLLIEHIFIFSAVAHTLALVTITPQGVGFVETGGYVVLSLGFFSLRPAVIGSFLIVWVFVRLWIPSIAGLITAWLDRGGKKWSKAKKAK